MGEARRPTIPYQQPNGLRGWRVPAEGSCDDAAPPRLRWPWLVLLAFGLGVWCGVQLHAAAPCVTLTVRPRLLLSRGDVDVQARVARHLDHRSLFVSWESEGESGSRTFDLDGLTDRVLFQWWNHEQPAGAYVFIARVFDVRGVLLGADRADILAAF